MRQYRPTVLDWGLFFSNSLRVCKRKTNTNTQVNRHSSRYLTKYWKIWISIKLLIYLKTKTFKKKNLMVKYQFRFSTFGLVLRIMIVHYMPNSRDLDNQILIIELKILCKETLVCLERLPNKCPTNTHLPTWYTQSKF